MPNDMLVAYTTARRALVPTAALCWRHASHVYMWEGYKFVASRDDTTSGPASRRRLTL